MDEQLVGTVTYKDYRAEIFSESIPGEFRVVYQDPSGKPLEEVPLTGISSYRQRESEITDRLRELSEGALPKGVPDLGDAGEY